MIARHRERGYAQMIIFAWCCFWPATGLLIATLVHPQRVEPTRDMAAVLRDGKGRTIPYTPEMRIHEEQVQRLVLTDAERAQQMAERIEARRRERSSAVGF